MCMDIKLYVSEQVNLEQTLRVCLAVHVCCQNPVRDGQMCTGTSQKMAIGEIELGNSS